MQRTHNMAEEHKGNSSSNRGGRSQLSSKEEVASSAFGHFYDAELTRKNDLDTKAGNLVGYVSVVTGLILGVGTFDLLAKLVAPESYVYFASIGLLLSSIILALLAMRIRNYAAVPDPYWLQDLLDDPTTTPGGIANELTIKKRNCAMLNFRQNESKALTVQVSWALMLAGLAVMTIFLFLYLT